MSSKRKHLEQNDILHQVLQKLFDHVEELPLSRGNSDGRCSFIFLPPDKSGRTIRRVDGCWERIPLSNLILINIGSRVHDTISNSDGTVIRIGANDKFEPILQLRMDLGGEILVEADKTHRL